ncbi:hypothetical protein D9M68_901830 [compost metagenome]
MRADDHSFVVFEPEKAQSSFDVLIDLFLLINVVALTGVELVGATFTVHFHHREQAGCASLKVCTQII